MLSAQPGYSGPSLSLRAPLVDGFKLSCFVATAEESFCFSFRFALSAFGCEQPTLSNAIEKEFSLTKCEKNDLCFEINDKIIFGKIRKFENFDSKDEKIPIIRLPGYAYQPGKSRFDTLVKKIIDEENISAKDFFIKEMQEISEPGGYRQAALISKDFKYESIDNSSIVEFTLPKGSYATTLLREIIKPDNPIHAGF